MDISIITIAYKNSSEVLRACFESVAKSEGVSWELIVVDNAGDAQILTQVSSVIPRATCILNKKNSGFAATVNQALRLAKGRYILVMSPGVLFGKDMLENMVKYLNAAPGVGVGSVVIRHTNGTIEKNILSFPSVKDQWHSAFKKYNVLRRKQVLKNVEDEKYLVTQDVDAVSGTCMWIRKEAADAVGFFDEQYRTSLAEVDYCKMMRSAGWEVRYVADSEVVYDEQINRTMKEFLQSKKNDRQSMRRYFLKHEGVWSWLSMWMLTPVWIVRAYGEGMFLVVGCWLIVDG